MSEFWLRKMRTYFRFLDIDKDGIVTRNDVLFFGDRFIEKENPDLQQQKKIRDALENSWKGLKAPVGSDETSAFTEPEFIETLKTLRNDPQFLEIVRETHRSFFEVIDTNGDGFVQEDEYKRCFASSGQPDFDESARATFRAIDINCDGKLSVAEISAASADFISSDDENSPCQLFFGPLI